MKFRLLHTAAIALAMLACGAFAADSGRVPKPVVNIEKPGKCVDDAQVMRLEHMNMLSHDRDKTVHQGIRKVKASFKECIDCHASQKTGAAAGSPGDFCQSCHAYVGVTLDCFECHSAKARTDSAAAPARLRIDAPVPVVHSVPEAAVELMLKPSDAPSLSIVERKP